MAGVAAASSSGSCVGQFWNMMSCGQVAMAWPGSGTEMAARDVQPEKWWWLDKMFGVNCTLVDSVATVCRDVQS